ncbi:unnamed protein product [Cuscuta campestris]|uniref:Retrotransposon gag domain-containing protein n=1 Tax=Cuscuta campestris TaxID=132261 RepID=A0A484KA19_9ASTE|nr:unnamed protein product [Cuscuta campestris]
MCSNALDSRTQVLDAFEAHASCATCLGSTHDLVRRGSWFDDSMWLGGGGSHLSRAFSGFSPSRALHGILPCVIRSKTKALGFPVSAWHDWQNVAVKQCKTMILRRRLGISMPRKPRLDENHPSRATLNHLTEIRGAPDRGLSQDKLQKMKPIARSGSRRLNAWTNPIWEWGISKMQQRLNHGRVFTTRMNTPLAPEIFAKPYPVGFKVPFVKRYDGESDPQEHIKSYVQMMIAVDAIDALMCRFFQTIDNTVADWVNGIPFGSIQTWDQLGMGFLEHLAWNCCPKKHFTHLASIRQKNGESLKKFLTRWRKESRDMWLKFYVV